MSASQFSLAVAYRRALRARSVPVSSLVSVRAAPTTRPSIQHLASGASQGLNGGTEVTPQRAAIEWLDDRSKLQIPEGLYRVENQSIGDEYVAAMRAFLSIIPNHPDGPNTNVAPYPQLTSAIGVDPVEWAGDVEDWKDDPEITSADAAVRSEKGVRIDIVAGALDDNDVLIARSVALEACTVFMAIKYGATDDDVLYVSASIDVGVATPDTVSGFFDLDGAMQNWSSVVSALHLLNYDVLDRGYLTREESRWRDDADPANLTPARLNTKTTGYSNLMIAALNLQAMNGVGFLAWVRAYGVSMGLTPHSSSLHNVEYQITRELPEDAEIVSVSDVHNSEPDGNRFLRACVSAIAGFGMLHLANDHTYKSNDESLLRKGRVVLQALRTVTTGSIQAELENEANQPYAIRACAHPFGMASSYGVYKIGLDNGLLSEPLMRRTTTVPPTVAKVGVVVGVYDKMMSLPIRSLIEDKFSASIGAIRTLRNEVVAHATEYSNLHRYYGHDNQRTLTKEQEEAVERLLPMVAAYADTFERDVDGNPRGAMLSWVLRKKIDEADGAVLIYSKAFNDYMEKDIEISVLLGNL